MEREVWSAPGQQVRATLEGNGTRIRLVVEVRGVEQGEREQLERSLKYFAAGLWLGLGSSSSSPRRAR
jgi:hypothetical protein